jgi:hypothetical protein
MSPPGDVLKVTGVVTGEGVPERMGGPQDRELFGPVEREGEVG